MQECGVCGYISDGEESPDKCPKCGAKKERFGQLEDKAVELVERSRYTNSLHIHLYGMLEQVADIAEEGIDDNLDPACVKIFTKAVDQAEILMQSIKAELEGHRKKGKWG
jgi:ERCC4-related helicase